MKANCAEIRVAGKTIRAPAARVCDKMVVVTGKWIRTASILDEMAVEGEFVHDPESFVAALRNRRL